ncbi:MAG: hypothetical protein ABSG57_02470 [Candidatus Bathyarchaeia archaeon]|jgi:hypothetical protein
MRLGSVARKIHRWDFIKVRTTEPDRDPRIESRKIEPFSIIQSGKKLTDREERRRFLVDLSEKSLDVPISEKRSLVLVKPQIVGFDIIERKKQVVQLTLNGRVFRKQPYGNVGLFYKWNCEEPCEVCQRHPHYMECFDWGAHVLWNNYPNKETAKQKVTEMCYHNMKEKYDTWFALGTHSKRPFTVWMIIGLLWMKKKTV